MSNQKGFTLIELVVVIVILGILAAIAVPKFVDLSNEATDASKKAMVGAVKSTFALLVAKSAASGTLTYPTVTALAAGMDGGTAAATGIQVDINGTTHTVLTYTDAACTTATAAVGNTVLCIGAITP